jgi:ATP-dependent protease ClpP protease subunit
MAAPNLDFRPNPLRAIYVSSTIDQDLIDKLTLGILSMQHESRQPITVYIDSPGGSTSSAGLLMRLLKSTNQDGADPCRIITYATGKAASAAADLLSSGDYAIAMPDTIVHFHGVRYSLSRPVTFEFASYMRDNIEQANFQFAYSLAKRCMERFLFRSLYLRSEVLEHARQLSLDGRVGPVEQLHGLVQALKKRVSTESDELLTVALNRYNKYDQLLSAIVAGMPPPSPDVRLAETEAQILKIILYLELAVNKDSDWALSNIGLKQIQDDFRLLISFVTPEDSPFLLGLASTWAPFLISEATTTTIKSDLANGAQDKIVQEARSAIQPLWFFYFAFCQCLQEGENEFPARDAFWLGLIDEVVGETSLPSLRLLVEHAADATQSRAPEA